MVKLFIGYFISISLIITLRQDHSWFATSIVQRNIQQDYGKKD